MKKLYLCYNFAVVDNAAMNTHMYNSSCFFFFLITLVLAALGLHCCMGAFSSCSKQGLLSSCATQVSHCGVFSCCGAQTQETCGIFPDQGLNLCPQYWQVNCYHWTTREALFLLLLTYFYDIVSKERHSGVALLRIV